MIEYIQKVEEILDIKHNKSDKKNKALELFKNKEYIEFLRIITDMGYVFKTKYKQLLEIPAIKDINDNILKEFKSDKYEDYKIVYFYLKEKTGYCPCGNIVINHKYCNPKCTSVFTKDFRVAKMKETYKHHTEEFKQKVVSKIRKTYKEKTGYDNPMQNPEVKEKVIQTNNLKYNRTHYNQSHINNFGNLTRKYILENFIENGFLLRDEIMKYYNFNACTYLNYMKQFDINLPIKNISKTEIYIYNNINTENKILNDRSFIKPKEIDILLPDHKLAIEYNGLLWHSRGLSDYHFLNDLSADTKFKHLKKTELVESKGFKLFHIFESDNLDIWLSMINNHLGLNTRIQARKTEIRSLKYSEVKDFLEQNHLQGSCTSSINYGLFYEQELVEVMTFGKSRFNRSYSYELLRLCTKKYTNVVGGASKLFARFLKDYPTGNIISYANRRFSNGKIYEKLGFNFIRKSEPNYFYFKVNENILYTRNKFQKHKLKKFNNYNINKSESQIMFENGFRQIFDSGNLVYEYKRESI